MARNFLTTFLVFTFSVSFASAQGPGGDRTAYLLQSESVRAELELLDEQIEDLKEVQEELQNERREMFEGMRGKFRNGNREEVFAEMREKMGKLNEKSQERLGKILLPHQMKRLKQLSMQARLRTQQSLNGFTSETMVETLDLTEEQVARLKEKQKQVEADFRKRIAQLRGEAWEQMMSELNAGQRAKLEESLGKPFEGEFYNRRSFTRRPGGGEGRPERGDRNRGDEDQPE